MSELILKKMSQLKKPIEIAVNLYSNLYRDRMVSNNPGHTILVNQGGGFNVGFACITEVRLTAKMMTDDEK